MVIHELLHGHLQHLWASDYSVGSSEAVSCLIIEAVKLGQRPSIQEDEQTLSLCCLMQKAWQQQPDERPTAEFFRTEIEKLLVAFYYNESPNYYFKKLFLFLVFYLFYFQTLDGDAGNECTNGVSHSNVLCM